MLKRLKAATLLAALILFFCQTAFALDDGFGEAKTMQSKYFTVYYSPEINLSFLAQQLNISPLDKILTGKLQNNASFSGEELGNMLDTLFLSVCDILDMNIYSFRGNIKVCKTHNDLKSVYLNLFQRNLGNVRSFFVFDLNTIYVSADEFKREIIGHEIGHAVQSHYFVVPPSIKVQEILSTYVEYQLKKNPQ